MRNTLRHFTCFFLAILTFATLSAQTPKKSLADNVRMDKQIQKLDSAIHKLILEEENEENTPSHDLYASWSQEKVNPYKVSIKDLPDSVYIDCSDYVAPIEGMVTSRFGPRKRRFHYGIDIKLNVGDTIVSSFDGKVRVKGYDRGGYGYYMVVRHNNGLETVYAHLSGYIAEENQMVSAGAPIALGGNTGRSTGPHLHFETRFIGNPINPEKMFDFDYFVAKQDNFLMVKKAAFSYDVEVKAMKAARYHKVKSGETLSSIASRRGTTIAKLCKLNNIKRTSTLRVGQKIRYS